MVLIRGIYGRISRRKWKEEQEGLFAGDQHEAFFFTMEEVFVRLVTSLLFVLVSPA